MSFECTRKKETLEWFLYREKFTSNREEADSIINEGRVKINNKIVKDVKYIPKKGDKFELIEYFGKGRGSKWFIIDADVE